MRRAGKAGLCPRPRLPRTVDTCASETVLEHGWISAPPPPPTPPTGGLSWGNPWTGGEEGPLLNSDPGHQQLWWAGNSLPLGQ